MYSIKMKDDKSLEATVQAKIYQYEKNADTLVFLLPRYYDDINLSDCTILLRYLLPNGIGKSEELEMSPLPHNKDYYRYNLKVNTRLTAMPGIIELWVCAIDIHDDVVLKTGEITIEVTPTKEITDYLEPKDLNQLDKLSAAVKELKETKADDLIVNDDGDVIQLSANGAPIGQSVTLPTWAELDEIILSPAYNSIPAILESLEEGSAVRFMEGEVSNELIITKSVTLKGVDSGVPQNFKQEVGVE